MLGILWFPPIVGVRFGGDWVLWWWVLQKCWEIAKVGLNWCISYYEQLDEPWTPYPSDSFLNGAEKRGGCLNKSMVILINWELLGTKSVGIWSELQLPVKNSSIIASSRQTFWQQMFQGSYFTWEIYCLVCSIHKNKSQSRKHFPSNGNNFCVIPKPSLLVNIICKCGFPT